MSAHEQAKAWSPNRLLNARLMGYELVTCSGDRAGARAHPDTAPNRSADIPGRSNVRWKIRLPREVEACCGQKCPRSGGGAKVRPPKESYPNGRWQIANPVLQCTSCPRAKHTRCRGDARVVPSCPALVYPLFRSCSPLSLPSPPPRASQGLCPDNRRLQRANGYTLEPDFSFCVQGAFLH